VSIVNQCGYVAIVGRPNVGKSTLLNYILGSKVSIVTDKPQTTRFQIIGVKTVDCTQTVYIDTPGLHRDEPRAMNRYMNRLASAVIPDADVVVFVVEAGRWSEDDALVVEKFAAKPVILVINKIDTMDETKDVLPFIEQIKDKYNFAQIVPISAQKGVNVKRLEEEIAKYLPMNPPLYPDDQLTDKNIKFQVAEVIREKLILATEQEVPYCTTVEIEQWKTDPKCDEISVIIWVEREGQKRIVIGDKGQRLKWIGVEARKDIEKLIDKRIFLRLWVKVKEHWTDDDRALRLLGYN
jgi:GTP-binding protein Era